MHIKHTIFLRVPCQVKQIFAIKAGDLLDFGKKTGPAPCKPCKKFPFKNEYTIFILR